MASLRKAAQCIGLKADFAVIRDLYGYWTGAPKQLSLLTQVKLLQGKHIHLNLIRTASFTNPLLRQIDAGLQFMRDTYAAVGVGVGRIQRFVVPQGGYEIIVSADVAADLMGTWYAPNDGVDVFLVLIIVGLLGESPTPGSCDKDDKDHGVIIDVFNNTDLGTTFAHEIGHYLGLEHEDDPNNLMFPSSPNGGKLTAGQGATMKLHCSMRAGCKL